MRDMELEHPFQKLSNSMLIFLVLHFTTWDLESYQKQLLVNQKDDPLKTKLHKDLIPASSHGRFSIWNAKVISIGRTMSTTC